MTENPVLMKEIRTRLRSRKSRPVQLAVGIPAGLLILVSYYWLIAAMLRETSPDKGQIWAVASVFQLVLICFITPGLLANSVSQEKEQRTWGLLLITRLSSWQIIWGKLVARLAPIPVLMLALVPFQVYSAVMSNLDVSVTAGTYLILAVCVFFFAVQALFWSWLFRRTSVATAAAYGTVFFLVAGTAVLEGLIDMASATHGEPTALMYLNPFYVLSKVLDNVYHNNAGEGIWAAVGMSAVYVVVAAVMLIVMNCDLERAHTE